MDNRFRRIPKIPGFHHFHSGISKISQWSGREAKDIQRYFLATLYGNQTKKAIQATRAELDFIFHAQWKTLSESDLQRMQHFNAIFHANKDTFLKTETNGGRDSTHFNIPKLHARHHYPNNICWLGAPYNYSTEISEQYHIDVVKKAYKATNRKDYVKQMIKWFTHQEQIHLFAQFLHWVTKQWSEAPSSSWGPDEAEICSAMESLTEFVEPEADLHEDMSLLPQSSSTLWHQNWMIPQGPQDISYELAKRPHRSARPIGEIVQTFQIPNFEETLKKSFLIKQYGNVQQATLQWYLQRYHLPDSWQKISVWHRFRITLPMVGFDTGLPEKRTILARLRTPGDPIPRFSTVFVDQKFEDSSPQDGLQGWLKLALPIVLC